MLRRPTVILLVLVLAAGVLTGWLAIDDPDTSGPSNVVSAAAVVPTIKDGVYTVGSIPDPDAKAALQAAVDAVPAALSYDYRSLDKSLARALSLMTPGFGKEFRETFEAVVRSTATADEVVASALVRAAGLTTAVKGGKVTCLVYVDQVTLATKGQKPPQSYDQVSVRVNLEKVDGTWKVSDLEPI